MVVSPWILDAQRTIHDHRLVDPDDEVIKAKTGPDPF
jgi:hypothetical protein